MRYETCQQTIDTFERRVRLVVHSGVKARDYSKVAKQEGLKPIEVQLQRVEDLARDTFERYQAIRDIEQTIFKSNSL